MIVIGLRGVNVWSVIEENEVLFDNLTLIAIFLE